MRIQEGEHPRIGAVDVCPFVPLEGVTMEECADMARKLAKEYPMNWEFQHSSMVRQQLHQIENYYLT